MRLYASVTSGLVHELLTLRRLEQVLNQGDAAEHFAGPYCSRNNRVSTEDRISRRSLSLDNAYVKSVRGLSPCLR